MEDPRTDDEAWDEVVRRWDEDEAHVAFLARAPGLDGLAEAGRRYKAALDARPGDPVAARWREEVLRRATAIALAQLPRTAPPKAASPALRRAVIAGLVLAFVAAVAVLALKLGSVPARGALR